MLGGGFLLWKLKSLVLHKKEASAIPRILPDDLYLEIFIRLPVKSTFTCKCVSKTWLSIISNPDFVKLHLNYTLKINKYSRFMVSGRDNKVQQGFHMYNITKDWLFSTSTSKLYGNALVREHHPFESSNLVCMVGSWNGLICLRHRDKSTEFFSLWNPSTKEYKRIPDSPYSQLEALYTFCYDHKNDDYKLVYAGYTPIFSVYVYTLRSNSWKCFQTKEYYFRTRMSVFVNGALHWISEISNIIVSFNISDESFKELQIPRDKMDKNHPYDFPGLILILLEGCLCVIHVAPNEAWVMREYGVWGSWTKHQKKTSSRYDELEWSSENGECLIYTDYDDLVLYDLKHSSVRRVLKLDSFRIMNIDNYVESLVSLDTGAYLERRKATKRGLWRKRSIRY